MTESVDMLKIIPAGVTKYYSMSSCRSEKLILCLSSQKIHYNTFFGTGFTVSSLIWE